MTDPAITGREPESALNGFTFDAAYALFTDLSKRAELQASIRALQTEKRDLQREIAELRPVLAEAETYRQVRARLLGELPPREAWAVSTLSKMDAFNRLTQPWEACPDYAGVYVLYRELELIYVGESGNIRSRLKQHNHRGFGLVRCMEVSRGKPARKQVEIRLIQALNPVENAHRR
jgi:hypothetical protein